MRITSIETQKRNPKRKNLFADGQFILGISDETLIRFGIRTGDEIGPEKLKALQQTEDLLGAKRAALRFLATRPRTEREVRDKLREKEFSDEEISAAIKDLKQTGLLNDADFARMFVHDAIARRPTGKLLLKQKMTLLGLDKATIEESLQNSGEENDQQSLALEAARKFIKKGQPPRGKREMLKARNRVANFLGRRGFTWDVIHPVLKSVFQDQGKEENEE